MKYILLGLLIGIIVIIILFIYCALVLAKESDMLIDENGKI